MELQSYGENGVGVPCILKHVRAFYVSVLTLCCVKHG